MNQALEDAFEYMLSLISKDHDYYFARFMAADKFQVSLDDLQNAFESIEGKPL